jgi:hypothetical protein
MAAAQEDTLPPANQTPPVYYTPIPHAPPTPTPSSDSHAPVQKAPNPPAHNQNQLYAAPSHGSYEPLPGGDAPDPALDSPPPGPKLRGVVFSLGNGVGLPVGSMSRDDTGRTLALSDLVSGRFSFTLGAGYRVSDLFSFGGFLQFGIMSLESNSCSSCSASDVRLGLETRLHFIPNHRVSPWASLGFGYERFTEQYYASRLDFNGAELNIGVGGDFRVTRIFTLGPFVGLQLGTFYSWSGSGWDSAANGSHDIPNGEQTVHGWVLLGIHGAFTI